MELNDVLEGNDSPAEVVAEQVTETEVITEPEVTASETPTEEVTTEEVTKGEKVAVPPTVEELNRELTAFKAKAQDEKRKRQELESRYAKPEAETEIPDVFDDPKGFLDEATRRASEQFNQRILASSQRRAERKYGDEFTEKVEAANEFLNANPDIAERVFSGDDPVEEAIYELQQFEEKQKLQDPNYVDKLTAEIEAKVRATVEAEMAAKADKTAGISPSLAQVGSSPVEEGTWTGVTPLSEVLAS
jgi:hypothetical protein